MKKKKKPEIRFEGFTDDWEQRKLLLICDFEKGRGLSKDNIDNNGKYPCILYGQLFTDYGMFINTVYSKSNIISEECKLSEKGDILIPRCDTTPDGLGRASVLALDNVILGFDINILKIKNKQKYDSGFVSVALNHHKKDLLSKVVGSTVRHLENKELRDVSIEYPNSLEEQKKVGEYFQALDHLITLHQRKYEKLKNVKKSMLEKMFPSKGCKVPEIRFSGFTDDWEQRKLGDVYGSIGNAFVGTATPYYVEHGHFYLESNNIKDGKINHNSEIFINDEFYEKQKEKWLHTGDIVMVQSGHVGHAAVIPEELDNTAAHALIMFKNPKEKIEPYFLNYEYQTDKAKKKIENITTGNTIKHILASDMQEFEVDVPKCKEQKVIASYFCKLDHLITLHQRELEKLKNIKKTLLEKMF